MHMQRNRRKHPWLYVPFYSSISLLKHGSVIGWVADVIVAPGLLPPSFPLYHMSVS